MNHAVRNIVLAAIGAASLAACGSSGSGGDTGGAPTAGTGGSLATITPDNAPIIAGVVAEVALEQGVFDFLFQQDLPIASSGTERILSTATKIASPSQLLPNGTGLVDCAVSGTVDVDVTVADPFAPSVNDRYALVFTSCDDGLGTVTNGSMVIMITALGGDFTTEQFLLGMSLELSAFQVTEGVETSGASGTIAIEFDSMSPPLTTISVSTSALAVTTEGMAEAVTDLSVTISEDQSMFPAAIAVSTSFTISSPRIGGEVSVSTSLALQSTDGEYPYVGELRITGADQSVIIMIAIDANTVRLEIDIDGDGAMDETIETTWDEILAAASG